MSFNRALIFGSITGVAGATLWAAIAYFANLEIGWLAWGIGLAVGLACVKGAGYGSRLIGMSAVVITLLAILLGKYAAIELQVNDEFGDPEVLIQESIATLNDETLTSYVADTLIEDLVQKGENVEWPAGVDPEYASTKAEYPPEIWNSAAEQWNALTQEEKQEYRQAIEASIRENFGKNFNVFQDEIRNQGFLNSFGLMDLVFFGLAVYTAFSVAKSDESNDEAEADDSDPDDTIPALK